MYKKYTVFALVGLFLLCCVLYAYYTDLNQKQTVTQYYSGYILKSDNETVSLYHNGKFVRSYDIDVTALPPIDRDNLESGIKLPDISSVNNLIQDFDGI